MNLAVLGPGAIGSTLAYQLARAGHTVTVVARGARLAQLEKDGAIVHASGERAPVTVAPALDPTIAYDLVLVTVLAPQVAAVLPALRESRAQAVMFLFNTFESIDPLREAVGAQRFAFGFPAGIFTLLIDGRIHPQIRAGTTVGDARWAPLFTAAGIPTVTEPDMQSWLRSHAALVLPLMFLGCLAHTQKRGATWAEASTAARAMRSGFDAVRALGHAIRPAMLGTLAAFPKFVTTAMLWALSRTKVLRDLGALGPAEPRMLADMMSAASPAHAPALQAARPASP